MATQKKCNISMVISLLAKSIQLTLCLFFMCEII